MESNRRSAVYVGAGTDTRPVRVLSGDVDDFIYIDPAPDGAGGMWGNVDTFVNDFTAKMAKNGWVPTSGQEDVRSLPGMFRPKTWQSFGCFGSKTETPAAPRTRKMTYARCGKTLTYYTHTHFPTVPTEVAEAIRPCSAIILSGFDPDGSLLDMVQKGSTIYAFDRTVYEPCGDDNGVFARMWKANMEVVFMRMQLPRYLRIHGTKIRYAQELMNAEVIDPYDDTV